MSISPAPPPGKKEPNTGIHVAIISACGACLAAAIPIVSNTLSHHSGSETPSSISARSATDSELSANQIADRTAYYVTLTPYQHPAGASGAADTYTAVDGAYFRSPKDAKHWIQLTITQHDHNQVISLSGSDYRGKTDSDTLNANKVRDNGDRAWVDTKSFKIKAEVVEAKTEADPDTTAPRDGRVFQKLALRISCEDHS